MKRWFENKKISFRITFGFILAIIIAMIIGAVGILSLSNINKSYNSSYTDSMNTLDMMEEISSSFQRSRMNLYGIILAESQADKNYYLDRMYLFENTIHEKLDEYKKILSAYNSDEIRNILNSLETIDKGLEKYEKEKQIIVDTMGMKPELRMQAYNEIKNGEVRNHALVVDEALSELIQYEVDFASEEIKRNQDTANTATIIMIIIIAIGTLIAILMAIYIARGIARPINEIVKATEALALGDINVKVEANTEDEIGTMSKAFQNMIGNIRDQALTAERIAKGDLTRDVNIRSEEDVLGIRLQEIVDVNNEVLSNIVNAAVQVAAGSKQVSDSSMDLSQGSTEQASSVEELTAAVEQISSQTQLNAQHAMDAKDIADGVRVNAERGNDDMEQMLVAMQEINESSNNISKIIKVIDEIAFQTNILALNAAVEAARAGQHGKGFAVVAEEVRNLAARSANAAKETTDMIEDSIKKAENGTRIANETANALTKIVNGVTEAANLINNIALASKEQALGIEQINEGINQIADVVQNTSATSQETAAASEELSSQADLLQDQVQKFKLKKTYKGSYRDADDFNPDVMKMLDEMGDVNTIDKDRKKGKKISLSDKEFGKY